VPHARFARVGLRQDAHHSRRRSERRSLYYIKRSRGFERTGRSPERPSGRVTAGSPACSAARSSIRAWDPDDGAATPQVFDPERRERSSRTGRAPRGTTSARVDSPLAGPPEGPFVGRRRSGRATHDARFRAIGRRDRPTHSHPWSSRSPASVAIGASSATATTTPTRPSIASAGRGTP